MSVGNEAQGPASPLATAEPWDLVAEAYAEDALPYFESFSREALRLAELPADPHIADVACGPGTLGLLAAAAGARVSAIDVSPRMVEAFRARAALPGLPIAGGRFPLSTPEEIRAELSAAGFRVVSVETVSQQLNAASFEAFWETMLRTNAPLALIRHRLADRWAALMPRIRDRVHTALGDGPVVIGRGAYLGI